jgi:hypothetical protein
LRGPTLASAGVGDVPCREGMGGGTTVSEYMMLAVRAAGDVG